MAPQQTHPVVALFGVNPAFCSECDSLLSGSRTLIGYEPSSATVRSCPACLLWERAITAFPEISNNANLRTKDIYVDRDEASIFISIYYHDANPAFLEIYTPTVGEELNYSCRPVRPNGGVRTTHIQECRPESGGACLSKVSEWLSDCLAGHPNTNRKACTLSDVDPLLPTRILFLPAESANRVFLLETGCRLEGRYTALSYCWGEAQSTRTTAASVDAFKKSDIPIADLPKTMRDAVMVTRHLGIQYLWIDALDSPDDWALESGKMGAIYRDATLVISASDSTDCTGGLFFPRGAPRALLLGGTTRGLYVRPKRSHRSKVTNAHHMDTGSYSTDHFIDGACSFDALHHRAWVFQERYLATRTLHFATHELGWSCPSVEACECEGSIPDSDLVSSLRRRNMCNKVWAADFVRGKGWTALVSEYSALQLTRKTDLLPALSGIAESLTISGDSYAFGLWQSGIQRGDHLHWLPLFEPPTTRVLSPPDHYAPSWSWASIHCRVMFRDWSHSISYRWIFDFVHLSSKPASANPYGPGTGELRLRGHLVPIYPEPWRTFYTRRSPDYQLMNVMALGHASDPDPREMIRGSVDESADLETDVFGSAVENRLETLEGSWTLDVGPSIGTEKTELFFFFMLVERTFPDYGVLIRRPEGMVLKLVSAEGEPCYQRIGWGHSSFIHPTEWWKTCGTRDTVTII